MVRKIFIEKLPFDELIRSAYEAYNVECDGILFGEFFKKKLLYVIEQAHPRQLVKRTPQSITEENGSSRCKINILGMDLIGEYHSHVTSIMQKNGKKRESIARVNFSELDGENLKKSPKNIEVVIALRNVEMARKLKNDNSLLISGYVEHKGKTYRIDIGGYYCDSANSQIRRAALDVPKVVLRGLA